LKMAAALAAIFGLSPPFSFPAGNLYANAMT
jgi:hypothetical protein